MGQSGEDAVKPVRFERKQQQPVLFRLVGPLTNFYYDKFESISHKI